MYKGFVDMEFRKASIVKIVFLSIFIISVMAGCSESGLESKDTAEKVSNKTHKDSSTESNKWGDAPDFTLAGLDG